jgi:16S rRNA processing protein RimM
VGRVVKPHGLRGEVIVELVTNRFERLDPGSVLGGPAGPLEVVRSSPHQGRFIVAFAGVADREAADALRDAVLSAEALDDPDALWVHELVGAEVEDVAGASLGRVVAVEANPASDLLVLDGGGLVPLRFVVSSGAGRVVVDPPAGLLE